MENLWEVDDEKIFKRHILSDDDKLKYWGYGEWIEEPDELNFEHEGIKCIIKRIYANDGFNIDGSLHIYGGHLCGYVNIPKYHPYFCKDIDEIDINVHGGLTFSQHDENLHLIGFDCAHSMDLIPSMKDRCEKFRSFFPENLKDNYIFFPTYKNIYYCIEECKLMANQLCEIIKKK